MPVLAHRLPNRYARLTITVRSIYLPRRSLPSLLGLLLALLLAAPLAAACGRDGSGGSMILATTTSTDDSGLLDVLIPLFRKQTGIEVKVIAVGTGAALEMAAKGNADAVLVHAPESEERYIAAGHLIEGQLVMHNDFVLVGPASDPAGISAAPDLAAAMGAIGRSAVFVSRADDSGTHQAEMRLWEAAGIDPASVARRLETGQGMGATLNVASERRAYTLTDRATYLALRKNLDLEILFEGARPLLNIYHVHVVNPEKHRTVKPAPARAFAAFLVAPETQKLIGEFRADEFGQSLFVPDAGKTLESLGQ
jgi:tungstate transport system substrate-binding protein